MAVLPADRPELTVARPDKSAPPADRLMGSAVSHQGTDTWDDPGWEWRWRIIFAELIDLTVGRAPLKPVGSLEVDPDD